MKPDWVVKNEGTVDERLVNVTTGTKLEYVTYGGEWKLFEGVQCVATHSDKVYQQIKAELLDRNIVADEPKTLRDEFAIAALSEIRTMKYGYPNEKSTVKVIVRTAYLIADAMMEERK